MAGFGAVDISKLPQKPGSDPKKPEMSKYRDFMSAIHDVAFETGNIDEKTELAWNNIEGEVLAELLKMDSVGFVMMKPVRNRMFGFKNLKQQQDEFFTGKFVELMNRNPMLFPAVTHIKQKLNELMVSFQRHGRMELVAMVQSFQVQMQDTTGADPSRALLRR